MIKTATIRIPRKFYDDHEERGLPAPAVLKATSRHYWIDALSRDLDELLSDARYYAEAIDFYPGSGMEYLSGLVASARATVRAIEAEL